MIGGDILNNQILNIIINELKVNNIMNFMDIVRVVWNKGIDCKSQTVANILHIHCINHKRLRKTPYFEKVGYGIWKLYDTRISFNDIDVNTNINECHNIIEKEIHNFFNKYRLEKIDFYGEAELQMKIGWHFMNTLKDYRIEAERPASIYGIDKKLSKKEIDLVLVNRDTNDKYAIELKSHFFRQGAYNKRIHYTLKDIQFLEELKETNIFKSVISVCFTESHHYYEIPNCSNAQFNEFRRYHRINKGIHKCTNEIDVNIKHNYEIKWIKLKDKERYYILEV